MNKNILFFTTPAYGHIIPIAPIVKELIKNGCNVTCYSSFQFEKEITTWGAKFLDYPYDTSELVAHSAHVSHFELVYRVIETEYKYYYDILNQVKSEKYDLILYDHLFFMAKHIAFKLGLKSVCFRTTFAVNIFVMLATGIFFDNVKMMMHNRKIINKIKEIENKFRKRNFLQKFKMSDLTLNKGTKTLVLITKEIQIFASTFPDDVVFVGTTIKDRIKENIFDEYVQNDDSYDCYVSLGTIHNNNQKLIKNIVSELAESGKKTLVSTCSEGVVFDMKNVFSQCRVNQAKILPKTKLFINHAGLNSVFESIYFCVPQFCFPQTEEQTAISKLVRKLKLGSYSTEYKKGVLKNIKYSRTNLKYYSNILKETDGTKNSVDIIMAMLCAEPSIKA